MSTLKLSDLKEAGYNPRFISDKRLTNLSKSMGKYGDLSGVVFNQRSKTLVSGHQRLKTLRVAGVKTQIETKKAKDKFGTVAEGYIVAKLDSGELRIPLRIVDWSDKKVEMAANIAANAHGGDFDKEKLGAILKKLENGKEFDVDTIGLDPLSIRGLVGKVDVLGEGGSGNGSGGEFQEFDEDSFDLEHTCPKCNFQFNTSAASKSGGKPKINKRVEATKKTLADKKAKKAKAEKADKKSGKKDKGDKVKSKKSFKPEKSSKKIEAKPEKSGKKKRLNKLGKPKKKVK